MVSDVVLNHSLSLDLPPKKGVVIYSGGGVQRFAVGRGLNKRFLYVKRVLKLYFTLENGVL